MFAKKIVLKGLVLLVCLFLLSASTVLSQDFCEGDFDCNGVVDGNDAITFKQDFGRFDCPECPSQTPVPKTGQTTSYEDYDDGYYEKGIEWPSPRFTDNGDGTVTDNLTGLVWLKDANCFGERTWYQAVSDCNGLAEGEDCGGGFLLSDSSGAGDWRLPNVRELFSLIDFEECNPSLPSGHPFINVRTDLQPDDYYHSSTTYKAYVGGAWVVRMFDGYVNGHYKTLSYYVWPVRGPE